MAETNQYSDFDSSGTASYDGLSMSLPGLPALDLDFPLFDDIQPTTHQDATQNTVSDTTPGLEDDELFSMDQSSGVLHQGNSIPSNGILPSEMMSQTWASQDPINATSATNASQYISSTGNLYLPTYASPSEGYVPVSSPVNDSSRPVQTGTHQTPFPSLSGAPNMIPPSHVSFNPYAMQASPQVPTTMAAPTQAFPDQGNQSFQNVPYGNNAYHPSANSTAHNPLSHTTQVDRLSAPATTVVLGTEVYGFEPEFESVDEAAHYLRRTPADECEQLNLKDDDCHLIDESRKNNYYALLYMALQMPPAPAPDDFTPEQVEYYNASAENSYKTALSHFQTHHGRKRAKARVMIVIDAVMALHENGYPRWIKDKKGGPREAMPEEDYICSERMDEVISAARKSPFVSMDILLGHNADQLARSPFQYQRRKFTNSEGNKRRQKEQPEGEGKPGRQSGGKGAGRRGTKTSVKKRKHQQQDPYKDRMYSAATLPSPAPSHSNATSQHQMSKIHVQQAPQLQHSIAASQLDPRNNGIVQNPAQLQMVPPQMGSNNTSPVNYPAAMIQPSAGIAQPSSGVAQGHQPDQTPMPQPRRRKRQQSSPDYDEEYNGEQSPNRKRSKR